MRRSVPERRTPFFEFVGGKGGVGKTTTAAALALGAAGAGRRTLVVSTDPAHSLGDVLARRVGARLTRVPSPGAALDALELDADQALARWLRARSRPLRLIAERGTYLDEADVDRFLGLSFPGVDELGGLLELTGVAEAGRYDTVVVDTAPTGHTLRLLAVPETLGRIATVLDEMLAKHHFLLTRLGGADRRDAADHLVAEIDAEARRLAALLRDPCRSRFRWMVLPEMLAVEEAQDAVQALEGSGLAVDEILVNRVAGIGKTGRTVDRRRVAAEQRAVAAVRKAFGGRPIRLLPELAAEPRGLAGLRPLVRALSQRSPASVRLALAPAAVLAPPFLDGTRPRVRCRLGAARRPGRHPPAPVRGQGRGRQDDVRCRGGAHARRRGAGPTHPALVHRPRPLAWRRPRRPGGRRRAAGAGRPGHPRRPRAGCRPHVRAAAGALPDRGRRAVRRDPRGFPARRRVRPRGRARPARPRAGRPGRAVRPPGRDGGAVPAGRGGGPP